MPLAMSPKQAEYFDRIQKQVDEIYDIAKMARSKGLDPSIDVECPPALDMAGRVETLVGPRGIADLIELGKKKEQIKMRSAFGLWMSFWKIKSLKKPLMKPLI